MNKTCFLTTLWFFLTFAPRMVIAGDFLPDDAIHSGVPGFDTNGQLINCHGLGIIQVGNTFYMVGEKRNNNVFPIMGDLETNFIGISLYASDDLVNWKHLPDPLVPLDGTEIGPDCIVERPKMLYNRQNKEFILYLHTWKGGGEVGICTSAKVEGPYAYRGTLKFEDGTLVKGGDIGVYRDTNDTAYLLETSGNIYRLSPDYKSALQSHRSQPLASGSLEAPAMFKQGDIYYFLSSWMSWWHNNDNHYATAPAPEGPWTDRGIFCPEGTKTWNSQTTWVLPIVGSKVTTCIYMGDRWSDGRLLASCNVWQPLMVDGATLSLPYYHPEWKIDLVTGEWKDTEDAGLIVNDVNKDTATTNISYKGKWIHAPEETGDHSYSADDSYSNTPDDTASLKFEGKRVRLYSVVDHAHGILGITLYNGQGRRLGDETDVDLYTDGKRQGNYLAYVSPVLPIDKYEIVVRVTGRKNHYSSGNYGVIDRLSVER